MLGWFTKHRRAGSSGRVGAPSVPLVLYSRPACHLCDVMKEQLAGAHLPLAWHLVERNIDDDPALVERFGESIPVLEIGGRVAFKGRLEAGGLERKFRRLAEAWLANADPGGGTGA